MPTDASPLAVSTSTLKHASPRPRSFQWKPEIWIGRLGVGLLILGVLFLFQYAVDQGWLGPWFRVGFGILLGFGMALVALRTEAAQQWFRQLLLGAALATWYLTLYAASQIYGLFPGGLALFIISGLAVLAYFLSLRERSATIAFLATGGGLISPLLLLEGASISAVELLMTVILSLAAMAYYCRRGSSLQVILVFLLGGLILIEAGEGNGTTGARVCIQFVWLVWGALLAAATLLRNYFMRTAEFPARIHFIKPEKQSSEDRSGMLATGLLCLVPLIWFMATSGIWNLPKPQAGWVAFFLAVLAFVMRRKLLANFPGESFYKALSDVLLFHSLLFGLAAVVMILDGSLQLVCISVIGFTMLQWAISNQSGWFRALGNFLFAASLFWVLIRVIDAAADTTYSLGLSTQCWVDFLVVILALGQCVLPWRKSESVIYWIAGMPILLIWVSALLSGYEFAGPVLTLLWSAIAVALLMGGILQQRRLWNVTGVLMLFLVMFKLFLYDLASVDAVWRVSLFLLLGGVFLMTSYGIAKFRARAIPQPEEQNRQDIRPPELPSPQSSTLEKTSAGREDQS